MEFRELEYIIVIAQEQTLSRAAERLYITQPALSRFLLRLEDRLGTPLFFRRNRRYVPTYAGELYIQAAKHILETAQGFNQDLARYLRSQKGRLSIGTTPGRGSTIFPRILPEFRQAFPDYELQIYEDNVETLERYVADGTVHLAFFTLAGEFADLPKGISYELINNEEIIFVTPAEDRYRMLASRQNDSRYPVISLKSFEKETFLLLKDNLRLGKYSNELLTKYDVSPEIIRFGSINTVLALVAQGFGVAFSSSFLIEEHSAFDSIYTFSLGSETECWPFVAAHQIDYTSDPAASYLLQLISNLCTAQRTD